MFLFGCYSSTTKTVKKQDWEISCEKTLRQVSYDEFLKKANIEKRSDSLITLKIDTISRILESFLYEIDSLFVNTNISIIRVEILPNGKTVIKNYNDTLLFDTTVAKIINKGLLAVSYDSISGYIACKEIILKAKKDGDRIQFDQNYKMQFISTKRSRASVMCVSAKNLPLLRYAYNKRLKEKPGLKGRISVLFSVNDKGTVISSKVTSSTINDKILEAEILKKINEWKYPVIYRPRDVRAIFFPFVFSQ